MVGESDMTALSDHLGPAAPRLANPGLAIARFSFSFSTPAYKELTKTGQLQWLLTIPKVHCGRAFEIAHNAKGRTLNVEVYLPEGDQTDMRDFLEFEEEMGV